MQANELRVGNWIFDSSDEQKFFQIEEIRKDSDGFEGYYAVYRNGSIKSLVNSDILNPIRLTPEILEKAGFNYDGMIYKKYIFFTIPTFGSEGESNCIQIVSFGNSRQTNAKYLHQLQNLYFALTGQELNIEL